MLKNNCILAAATMEGRTIKAEFDSHTGRLRILDGKKVQAEWFPPHSWFAIASVAGRKSWGTKPSEADLQLVVDDFASRHQ
ncbi:hypothetical protein B0G71_0702 [Paraburkholderia sp. BL27I4N3]|uniref:hypothetical protein n=1 Tax=Paraburkholderia sp. BL27I4N3 TaxID=1938805 RepID=UPI000E362037|nr:hypothetical protein [Paraburkholderia sp. BL27I4N3]REE17738.1 hypothetical protein B0G71_0702 [Paraburkholderia sp. BL27I4N3]